VYDRNGLPEEVLVLGGGSEIARSLLERFASQSLRTVVLLGPHLHYLAATRDQLHAAHPGLRIIVRTCDLAAINQIDATISEAIRDLSNLDCVIMASGWLGDQSHDEQHPAQVGRTIAINFQGQRWL
jgi:decaprenylphospho-beta-D-erythro-pentofuranosid-2-ulose 2-reductase